MTTTDVRKFKEQIATIKRMGGRSRTVTLTIIL
jgi:hypothetical protein